MNRAFQFARVRREGTSTAGRLIVLSAFPLEDSTQESQFGIICTKKVASSAVVRNKLKRRIREIIRAHGSRFEKGYHLVTVLRWRAVENDYAQLEKDWIKTSGRLLRQISETRTTGKQQQES